MAADGLTLALDHYQRAQDELVKTRNRLASAIAGAAMSGMTRDEDDIGSQTVVYFGEGA